MDSLLTTDRLDVLRKLARNLPDAGICAEVGVFRGGSLIAIAQEVAPRKVVGFDTFSGLPACQCSEIDRHMAGEFAESMGAVRWRAESAGLSNVDLVQGTFPETGSEFEEESFAFVHLDVDLYLSTLAALEWFWPRMVKGGVIVVDDYRWARCPGVDKALEEFGQRIEQQARYQAILRVA